MTTWIVGKISSNEQVRAQLSKVLIKWSTSNAQYNYMLYIPSTWDQEDGSKIRVLELLWDIIDAALIPPLYCDIYSLPEERCRTGFTHTQGRRHYRSWSGGVMPPPFSNVSAFLYWPPPPSNSWHRPCPHTDCLNHNWARDMHEQQSNIVQVQKLAHFCLCCCRPHRYWRFSILRQSRICQSSL